MEIEVSHSWNLENLPENYDYYFIHLNDLCSKEGRLKEIIKLNMMII
jgi:hypothetical protein